MKLDRRWWFGALAATGLACAHAQPSAAARDARAERVFVTGSHIPQPVDPATGLPRTISPVRVYSRTQLESTGRLYDMTTALGTLDPAITH